MAKRPLKEKKKILKFLNLKSSLIKITTNILKTSLLYLNNVQSTSSKIYNQVREYECLYMKLFFNAQETKLTLCNKECLKNHLSMQYIRDFWTTFNASAIFCFIIIINVFFYNA